MQGKHALITGASRGLGAALAHAFAAAGARVSICARGPEALGALAATMPVERTFATAIDVSDAGDVASWVAEAQARFGPPSLLVNNASVLGPRVPLEEYPEERWREVFRVNLDGAWHCARAVIPPMRAVGEGCIVNISSGAAIPPRERWGAYALSKQALDGLTMNLAAELRGTGIRVHSVDPGAMRTSMRAEAYPGEDPRSVKAPEAVVPLIRWLASDRAADRSGERFRADEWAGIPP